MPVLLPLARLACATGTLLPTLGSALAAPAPDFPTSFSTTTLVALPAARLAPPATGTVSGRVLDEKGRGLPGVTVLVDGTTLGSSTNADGTFSIPGVPAGEHVLVLSFVGYGTLRQPITVREGGNTAVAPQTLREDVTTLGEAVVVGYGTQRRQEVTGSVTTVGAREFVQGQVTSPEKLVQGKIAGVQVSPGGGAPGETNVIRIRGGSSLNASNDPLIVIDGVPVDNSGINGAGSTLALINPNDIATFTVLKDASATAIYGSRASNGVILITTKKGLSGEKLHVNLNSQLSRATVSNKLDVLSGDQYRALTDQAIANGYINADRRALVGSANTDWQDAIYRTAWTNDNNLSLTGSAGPVPFRVSGGYLDQDGTLRTGNLKRYTGSLGLSPLLFDKHLRIDLNLKGTWADYRFADQGAIGAAAGFPSSQPIYSTTPGTGYNGYFEWLDPSTNLPNTLAYRNPLAILNDKRDISTVRRSIGNVQFDYQVHGVPGLRANVNLGYDYSRSRGSVFIPAASSLAYSTQGLSSEYRQEKNNKLLETYLNYTRQLGQHRLELLAGYSYQDFYTYSPFNFTYRADGTLVDPTAVAQNPFKTQYTLLSYYGRLNYNYKEKYLFTATFRRDASSHFSPETRWGNFPAASVAWRLKQEEFLAGVGALSELKLRLGYGITGQQDIYGAAGNDYPYIGRYSLGAGSVRQLLGGQEIFTLRLAGFDPNLKWEETTTYNAGLDYGFLDGRFTGAVDLYFRKSNDLLAVVPAAAGTVPADRLLRNIGDLENKGIEFSLNYNAVRSERLDWVINFNVTANQNKITRLNRVSDPAYLGAQVGGISGGTNTIQVNSVGYPANSFFVYHQKYDANGKPIETSQPSPEQYEDLNGDGIINERDLYRVGSPAPKAYLGLGSNLTYRHLTLAFSSRANFGSYVYNNINSNRATYSGTYPAQPFVYGAVPDILYTQFRNPQYLSDYYLQKVSFWRLDNVTVGYDLGELLHKGSSLRLTLAGQNLVTVSNYKGLNPELPNGIDNNYYPLPRTFTLGVNATF